MKSSWVVRPALQVKSDLVVLLGCGKLVRILIGNTVAEPIAQTCHMFGGYYSLSCPPGDLEPNPWCRAVPGFPFTLKNQGFKSKSEPLKSP